METIIFSVVIYTIAVGYAYWVIWAAKLLKNKYRSKE